MAGNGSVPKDFDIINKDPGMDGPAHGDFKGTNPRSGEAKMDGGTNDTAPWESGNYKGKKVGDAGLFGPI